MRQESARGTVSHSSSNMAEKLEVSESIERRNSDLKNVEISEVKVVKGSEAFHEAKTQEPVSFFHPRSLLLFGCVLMGFFCQTMNGFDGSLFNGLTGNSNFLEFFDGTADGPWAAKVSAMYQIGSVVALPFVGPFIDSWGRRMGMFIGSIIVCVGTIISAVTVHNGNLGQFMGGRFLLGFGVAIASAAGPIYVVETCHPQFRSVVTAYANTTWFVGSILAGGACRGGLNLGGTLSWALPVWLQLFFSGVIVVFCFIIPESPRWLYVNGKKDRATEVLGKWHGFGNVNSAWVKLQLNEYETFLNTEGSDKRWWDYRALFNTAASRYRLATNCIFAIFAQWAGNGVLTYFLPAVLDAIGIKEDEKKLNINLGYACFQYVFALTGAFFVDKVGRRPMMLFSMGGCCVVWIGMTIAAAMFSQSGETNQSASKAVIGLIFIFGAVYSVGITPLQALYPVEVLSFEMRAKGMAFSSFSVAVGNMLNQFAWPISLKEIGWKTYIVFTCWDAIQFVIYYLIMPETKQRTLEELDEIFAAKNPVKHSLTRHKLALNSDHQVVGVEVLAKS